MSVEHNAAKPIDGEASLLGTRATWQEVIDENPSIAIVAGYGIAKALGALHESSARKYANNPRDPRVIDVSGVGVEAPTHGE